MYNTRAKTSSRDAAALFPGPKWAAVSLVLDARQLAIVYSEYRVDRRVFHTSIHIYMILIVLYFWCRCSYIYASNWVGLRRQHFSDALFVICTNTIILLILQLIFSIIIFSLWSSWFFLLEFVFGGMELSGYMLLRNRVMLCHIIEMMWLAACVLSFFSSQCFFHSAKRDMILS